MKSFAIVFIMIFLFTGFKPAPDADYQTVVNTLRAGILKEAAWALKQSPITVTAASCPRSAGGLHDFYSEGDYWWPDPINPSGPYIQRDGLTNPHNFTTHRQAMIRFSRIVGAVASAYKLTHNNMYARQAALHIKAWFVDSATLMNPNLQYAQAIQGVATGRGIGIIDTIHLMEVIKGMQAILDSDAVDTETLTAVKNWFARYLTWLTTHPYGVDEMNAKNNHGTCWVMQVACFAQFTGNEELLKFCTDRYKQVLLPGQMAANGSFPLELKRTKPYGYSIFNLDAMATICQLLRTPDDNLWQYHTPDGRSLQKGIEYLFPYLADKGTWPYAPDVMYWKQWPVAQPSLLFGALAYRQKSWLTTWQKLDHNPRNEELVRNLPVRHPLLWIN